MVMAKSTKEHNNELFFVEIKQPDEVRKDILETLKGIIELLQRFENFKRARHEKMERITKLRILMRDTNKLMGVLKIKLPQTNLRGMIPKHHAPKPKKAHPKKKVAEVKEPKKEKTHLDKLQDELNAIESKLKSFS